MPDETTPTPTAPPPAKRKRRASTPRAPKTLDPGILAIRQKMALEVAAYRSQQSSSVVLKRIVEKELPRLTEEDRLKLYDEISRTITIVGASNSPSAASAPSRGSAGD